ncbi:non-canonical purine NTP pyrophosphatase [Candidatus Daviesbacteria bacterium]|nr:non-canonical purine NTP pyrophosphatase [Candidatus Daviesbacteria bacterium]
MALYFITGSKHKFKEMQDLMPELKQLNIALPELQETDAEKIIAEKLKEAFLHHSGEFIVEDTSLYLDCLNGLPGPLIKWFLQKLGSFGLYKLTNKLDNSKALAKTIIGYAKDKNNIHFFSGEIKGEIVSPKGDKSFGWNDIFMPEGYNKTFAQMTLKEKNSISMRGLAVKKLKQFLQKN